MENFNFIANLRELLKKIYKKFLENGNVENNFTNENIVEMGRTDEEKEVIREMCEETDLAYKYREDYRQSGLTGDEWIEKQLEERVAEMLPDASEDEKNELKTQLRDVLTAQFAAQIKMQTADSHGDIDDEMDEEREEVGNE